MKRHLELQIKTIENAPRDADKLRQLLKVKRRQKEEAMHKEDTQRLVTERLKYSELYCSWWQVQAGKNRSSLPLLEAMLY